MAVTFYRSAVGKKAVMAATGILLWAFVLGHMIGNLKLFAGAEGFNHYAEWLRLVGLPLLPPSGLLWAVRLTLIVAVVLHVHAAWALTLQNRRARPRGYRERRPVAAGYAARTMRWSGAALLAFVVYHLLHFTTGDAHPDFVAGDVYHNVTVAFSSGWIVALYVAAMVLLGLHLFHGLWSMFQSLGWNHPRYNPWRRVFAATFAVLVAAGFVVVPILILAGLAAGS
jgi:succinate dehydrogenase / fumarate reductase cytochrome b subunit